MEPKCIAVLHPGEMGAAVGACLSGRGFRVLWVSEGRSPATRARARASALEDMPRLENVIEAADFVLSICPPHAAVDVAAAVAKTRFRGIYVDANAIAPTTTRKIGRLVEAGGATFVDGAIIGPPPTLERRTRLYLAGPSREEVAALFQSTHLQAIALEDAVGAASALKMCYAAWSKGTTALLVSIRALAQSERVDTHLLQEWSLSSPGPLQQSDKIPGAARKAWRWVAEMEEIAASFEAAKLSGGFHRAAADVYGRFADFKEDAATPALAAVIAKLRQHATLAPLPDPCTAAKQGPTAQRTSTQGNSDER
jgi:3-hydroxyisobutyrate dehydrogenase-like beta-hydroxyacid dehydrogenase